MVDSNQLTSLPTDLGQLSCLVKLSAKNNALTTLPTSISKLQNLCVLDVSSNQLVQLTAAVADCSRLEELNASDNKLQVQCAVEARSIYFTNTLSLLFQHPHTVIVQPMCGVSWVPKFSWEHTH